MAMTRKKYRIVYLIDLNLAECLECDHCNEVLLAALRLLLLFRKSVGPKSSQDQTRNITKLTKTIRDDSTSANLDIKWGFKLFSTDSTLSKNKPDNVGLRDFKLNSFSEFEKKLKETFRSQKEEKGKRRSMSHPAELLSTALTESLHDFMWNEEDVLTSPVTRKQGHLQTENLQRNIVILFAKAPHSKKALRQFANKVVLDSEVFIDSIMSPALLHEFQQKMKISLYWLDLTLDQCRTSTAVSQSDSKSIQILEDACTKLGGRLLTRDLVLSQIPSLFNVACSSEQILDPLQILSTFPVEALLSDLCDSTMHRADRISSKLTLPDTQETYISLMPVTVETKTRCTPSQKSMNTEDLIGLQHMADRSGGLKSCLNMSNAHFIFQGCILSANVCDILLSHSTVSYMLDVKENDLISSLLHQLRASQTYAILTLKTSTRPFVGLAILQSHSQGIGFITVLDMEASMQVEKSWLLQHDTSLVEENETECGTKLMILDRRQELMNKLNERLRNPPVDIEKKHMPGQCGIERTQIFNPHCMNSWHLPGITGQIATLAEKIKNRLDTSDNAEETGLLKQLQKSYIREKQPGEVVQNGQPSTSTPLCALRNMRVDSSGKVSSSGGSESGSRSSHGGLSRRLSSTLSRGRLMVDRARSASLLVAEDESESMQSKPESPERRRSSSIGFIELDLKTEDDLELYLQKQYDQVLSAGIAMGTTIQTMVTVTSQFMSNTQFSNPQKSAVSFIQKHLIVTSAKLRDKYMTSQSTEEGKRNKIAEYKLQVMLLLEMESLVRDADAARPDLTSELASLLRVLSFGMGAMALRDFLNDVIVVSYASILPKLLVDVYDELMLPLPAALAKFASPAAPSSVWGGPMSTANDESALSAPGSSQPTSNLSEYSSQQTRRSSNIKQHPSLSDFRQKKQILIKPKPKPKEESKKAAKEKGKTKHSSSSRSRRGASRECERAKRNLFSDKTKPSHSETRDSDHTSHRHKRKHTRSYKSRTLVLGTPAHKQTFQRHLQQQERRRRREANFQNDVQVIAESPEKDDDNDTSMTLKPARFIVREAFYSSNSQPSRNVTRSLQRLQSSDGPSNLNKYQVKNTRSHGTLASAVRGESPILSPRSRLLQSFTSPHSSSPKSKSKGRHSASLRRSPRKSVKKLVFNDNNENQSPSGPSRSVGMEDVHLLFDGDNANDFSLITKPTTSGVGYKTPEKQKAKKKPESYEIASCPPLMSSPTCKAPENAQSTKLNFSNILAQDRARPYSGNSLNCGKVDTEPKVMVRATPEKKDRSPFSSPDQASKLRAFTFNKSPNKPMSTTSVYSKGNTTSPSASHNFIISALPSSKTDGHPESWITPTKRRQSHVNEAASSKTGSYPTPKRLFGSQNQGSPQQIHSTPSKVKFSETCLVSSPTAIRCPPSAEKATPKKSILKSPPSSKGKVKRRIELQPAPVSTESSVSSNSSPFTISSKKFLQRPEPSNTKVILSSYGHKSVRLDSTQSTSAGTLLQLEHKKIFTHKGMEQGRYAGSNKTLLSFTDGQQSTQKKESNNKQKSVRGRNLSSCSDESSDDEQVICGHGPASVTIRTPSPSAKTNSESFKNWSRRKRSSSKNGSSSSSNSILSPTSSCSSNEEKKKIQEDRTETGEQNDAITGTIVGHDTRSRKRSLFTIADDNVVQSPHKRVRKNLGSSDRTHIVCNASLDREETSMFGPSKSPETVPWEVVDVFVQCPTGVTISQEISNFSHSSQGPVYNSSSTTGLPSSTHPCQRSSRLSNSSFGENSQGFSTQPMSSIDSSTGRNTTCKSVSNPSTSKCTAEHIYTTIQTSQDNVAEGANTFTPSSSRNAQVMKSPSGEPVHPSKRISASSAGSHSDSSPAHQESTSPGQKQYSPSLSATGLLHLIKSPLISPRSKREKQESEVQPRNTRSKSRKHLDWN